MMKSLVVNCSLNKQAKIEELLKTMKKFSECTTLKFREISAGYEVEKDIDAVVLSGSEARIVDKSHRDQFKQSVDLINRLDLPTLGVCFGHQLLCWSFGCKVGSCDDSIVEGFENVHILKNDEIFADFKESQMLLAESHYDYVKRSSLEQAGFVLLANSNSCEVEAVRHKTKPLYGVQFHPERIKIKDKTCLDGHKVIENFYKHVVK